MHTPESESMDRIDGRGTDPGPPPAPKDAPSKAPPTPTSRSRTPYRHSRPVFEMTLRIHSEYARRLLRDRVFRPAMRALYGIEVILHLVGDDADAERVETLIRQRLEALTEALHQETQRVQGLLAERGLEGAPPRYTHPITATVQVSSPAIALYATLIQDLDRLLIGLDTLWLSGVLPSRERLAFAIRERGVPQAIPRMAKVAELRVQPIGGPGPRVRGGALRRGQQAVAGGPDQPCHGGGVVPSRGVLVRPCQEETALVGGAPQGLPIRLPSGLAAPLGGEGREAEPLQRGGILVALGHENRPWPRQGVQSEQGAGLGCGPGARAPAVGLTEEGDHQFTLGRFIADHRPEGLLTLLGVVGPAVGETTDVTRVFTRPEGGKAVRHGGALP